MEVNVVLTLIIIVVCLVAEAFFSGSEIGLISADQMKLRHEAAKGSRGARLALDLLKKPEWLLSTTLVGTNIAVVTNTTMITALMIYWFGEAGSVAAILLAAPLIWIFGEIVPKSVFQQRADTITPRVAILLKAASYLFFPLLIVFTVITRVLTRLGGAQRQSPFTLREEIVTMMYMPATEGDIQPVEQTMIRRLFDFTETTAYEIMVPLIDVAAIEREATCGDAMRLSVQSAHVRLPVFEGRIDRIVGVVYTLELLGVDPEQPLASYVRPVRYVPGSKSINDLLLELRQKRREIAVVVDEFGGADGIVTLEDIMEEVVDDFQDEYDAEEQPLQWVRQLGERDYLVGARIEIDLLEEELDIKIPEGKYATLAGFLLERTQEVPQVGTVIEVDALVFTIRRATPQAIQEVRVRW